MVKKILIAVDNSLQSKNAVRYVTRLSARLENLNVVLFNAQPMVSQFLVDEAKKKVDSQRELKAVMERNAITSQKLLDNYRLMMGQEGVDESRIQTVTQPRKLDIAKDIIEFAQDGRFDALVIGRRGISGLQELFMGSVSSNITQNSNVIPVWIIDGDVAPAKFLVAVDGSEYSLRAIDHLAFALSDAVGISLTFLHVRPKLKDYCEVDFEATQAQALEDLIRKGDKACIDNFYTVALKKLNEFDIGEDRIQTKTVTGLANIGAAILKEVQTGNYDTVVMGRSGVNKSFFTGSVASTVLNKISKGALWLVP
ncbi:MAG: universal stress protein [Desulfobacterales bacterium]|jgi:nucleotide-binding universal stress UspA family protein